MASSDPASLGISKPPWPIEAGLKYRPDIDGLRALAVLPVIWFHSGLPRLPGGFTGVDTFFVISGYLITLIVHTEVQEGRFTFRGFYERRVRRIAPALLFMLAVSTIVAFALLLPYELEEYSRSGVAALAMGSNFFFWQTGTYFRLAGQIAPLLHTWSLGVEEQFYLFFPALLLVAERWGASRLIIGTVLGVSFVLCLVATSNWPGGAFYLLPARAWELMAGASLAVGMFKVPVRLAPAGGIVGVALLVGATVGLSDHQPFPGWRALIPVLGSGLIIGSGPSNAASRLLATRPLTHIGRISYSLYLWHWPVFALLRHFAGSPALSLELAVLGIAIAVIAAEFSYHLIETPARLRSNSYRGVLALCSAAGLAIFLVLAAGIIGRGFPRRLSSHVLAIARTRDDYAPLAHSCTDIGFRAAVQRCHIGCKSYER